MRAIRVSPSALIEFHAMILIGLLPLYSSIASPASFIKFYEGLAPIIAAFNLHINGALGQILQLNIRLTGRFPFAIDGGTAVRPISTVAAIGFGHVRGKIRQRWRKSPVWRTTPPVNLRQIGPIGQLRDKLCRISLS
ncbi:MAG: hypothetical protein U5N55_10925 [Cypionkella sp.]|nr:hypothetical protein [Cypionkella sp.]